MPNKVPIWTNYNLAGKISTTVIVATMAFYALWTAAVLVEAVIRMRH